MSKFEFFKFEDHVPDLPRPAAVIVSTLVGLGAPAAYGFSALRDGHGKVTGGAALPVVVSPAPQIEMATVAYQLRTDTVRVQAGSVTSYRPA